MANSVDPDEMAHYEPSHLDPYCLHMYMYRSTGLEGSTVKKMQNSEKCLWFSASPNGSPDHTCSKGTLCVTRLTP